MTEREELHVKRGGEIVPYTTGILLDVLLLMIAANGLVFNQSEAKRSST